jgi:hypothetical protein
MFDVYLNDRKGLLIVQRGDRFPEEQQGAWRKKRSVRSVSDRIRADIRAMGFHQRNLVERPASRNSQERHPR